MAYTTPTRVKDRIGASNVPSSVTDAMVGSIIVDSDEFIDAWGVTDSNVQQAASTAYAAYLLCIRIGTGVSTEASDFRLGKLSISKDGTARNLLAMGQEFKAEAERLLRKTRGVPISVVNS